MEGFLASTFMYRVVNIADATQRQLNNFVIKATAVPKFADEKKTVFMRAFPCMTLGWLSVEECSRGLSFRLGMQAINPCS
jgi:hypothetical protein